jgi:hypothetical protein
VWGTRAAFDTSHLAGITLGVILFVSTAGQGAAVFAGSVWFPAPLLLAPRVHGLSRGRRVNERKGYAAVL